MSATAQPSPSNAKKKPRKNRWHRLWRRWKRKGIIEININHHRYKLLECIREGIQDILINHSELEAKDTLTVDDFTHVLTRQCTSSTGKSFIFKSYASSVFAAVRNAVSVHQQEYLSSLAPSDDIPYLEFVSNSKSGQDFYLSNDQQFILKTERKYYVNIFLTFLGEYLEHFQTYPHSLIVKFLGLYSVQVAGESEIFFLSMQNIFFPSERIEIRYDIKGCYGGRYQKPYPKVSGVLSVLKDQNFKNQIIEMGNKKEWFQKQLRIDVDFLRELGVQDYSLLLGKHSLHVQDYQESFGNLVLRMRRTFARRKSSLVSNKISPAYNKKPVVVSEGNCASSNYTETRKSKEMEHSFIANNKPHERKLKYFKSFENLIENNDDLHRKTQNRRLLPNCKNPLHVIDGAEDRYYLGIIDFFTKYECRQRSGRILKTLKYCTGNQSTVPSDLYAERFLQFILDRTN